MVFRQPLRQTQGLVCSIAKLLGVEIAVPSFSTLSRRGNGLTLRVQPQANGPAGIQLVVDSTGLKIQDAGEWLEEKHKTKRKRRSWRKLHLGLDLVSGEIVCSDLTADGVGDSSALLGLLDQIDVPADLFLANGASDGDSTCNLLLEHQNFSHGAEAPQYRRQLPITVRIPIIQSEIHVISGLRQTARHPGDDAARQRVRAAPTWVVTHLRSTPEGEPSCQGKPFHRSRCRSSGPSGLPRCRRTSAGWCKPSAHPG